MVPGTAVAILLPIEEEGILEAENCREAELVPWPPFLSSDTAHDLCHQELLLA